MNILAGHFKPDAVAFRIGICHQGDFFFGKSIQIARHAQLIFCYIFAEPVQIAQVRQITFHDYFKGKIFFPVKGGAHAFFQHGFGIVTGEPVDHVPDFLIFR